jgi:hypothetical protein
VEIIYIPKHFYKKVIANVNIFCGKNFSQKTSIFVSPFTFFITKNIHHAGMERLPGK